MSDSVSLYREGLNYYNGSNGYPLNYKMAFELWNQSAQLGLPEAHIGLAIMYNSGMLDTPNADKAAEHFHQAYYANPNHRLALYHMARIYANGLGVSVDTQKALSFLNSYFDIADTNDKNTYCNACYIMGQIMLLQENYVAAVPYISIASERVMQAKYLIGSLSYHGYAKGKYYQDPFSCFKEAAENGSVSAMYDLGIMYNKNKLPDKAHYWLEKAAKNGHKEAIAVLKKLKKIQQWGSFF